jgi:hypothetical protein
MRSPTMTAIALVMLATASLAAGCGGTSGQGSDGAPQVTAAAGDVEAADPGAGPEVAGGACTTDADCVPAECCHPKTCTHKDSAPDCHDMMCTLDCRGGTMDCGGGRCLCRDGKCAAEILPPKQPKILSDPPPPMPQ